MQECRRLLRLQPAMTRSRILFLPTAYCLLFSTLMLEGIPLLITVVCAAIALVLVMRWRTRDSAINRETYAHENVCDHLRPALDHVLAKGSRITRVGQNHPDLPLEIHLDPPFDPQAVYDELKLAEPVFVSERNVLFCKEDWCELHPEKR